MKKEYLDIQGFINNVCNVFSLPSLSFGVYQSPFDGNYFVLIDNTELYNNPSFQSLAMEFVISFDNKYGIALALMDKEMASAFDYPFVKHTIIVGNIEKIPAGNDVTVQKSTAFVESKIYHKTSDYADTQNNDTIEKEEQYFSLAA